MPKKELQEGGWDPQCAVALTLSEAVPRLHTWLPRVTWWHQRLPCAAQALPISLHSPQALTASPHAGYTWVHTRTHAHTHTSGA